MATDNPLSAFFRGFQGAQKAAQAQQQQEVENELSRQLRAIQQAQLQKQLTEASKPLNERFLEAFLMGKASRGEVSPFTGAVSTDPALAAQQAVLGPAVGIPEGLQAPGLSEALAQVTNVPSIPGVPQGLQLDMETPTERQIRVEAARRRDTPVNSQFVGFVGNTPMGFNPRTNQMEPIKVTGGIETAGPLDPKIKPKTATGDLTVAQQNSELAKASKVGVDSEQFRDPVTQKIDFAELSKARGAAEGEAVNAENVIKNARLSARGSKPTVSQENFKLYGNRMEQADKVLESLSSKGFDPTSIGVEGQVGAWLPNLLKSADRQSYEQAQRNFVNAVLRKESGAVISQSEFENARAQYFPQPGDSEDLLAQKAATRRLVIDEFRTLGSGSSSAVPASTAVAPLKVGRFTVTPK